MPGRYEFRVFGDVRPARRVLEGEGVREGEPAERTDTYLVVPDRVDASLKIRGAGALDLKLLRDLDRGLERWEPAGSADLPVAAGALVQRFLGPAGFALDVPGGQVDRERLLSLVRGARQGHVRSVTKRRRSYRLGGVSAEAVDLSLDGEAIEAVAVEDENPDAVIRAVRRLGLAGRRNVSYQRLLVETGSGPDAPARSEFGPDEET